MTLALLPLSLLYRFVYSARTALYSHGVYASYRASVPVIIVGNLTVGGAGKTPLVIELLTRLQDMGFNPGVISRGYGSRADNYPLLVDKTLDPAICGDEPLLIAQRTGLPVVIGPNRRDDVELLLSDSTVDIIVSDDGLQHLALGRDIEICLIDKTTHGDNQFTLPAGPYREPVSRFATTNINVLHVLPDQFEDLPTMPNDLSKQPPAMTLKVGEVASVNKVSGQKFEPDAGVHAVAGIGKPERFFASCRQLGWNISSHAFADHHAYIEQDLDFADDLPIVMTEKDAVKCQNFAQDNLWYLPVDAKLNTSFEEQLRHELQRINLL